MPEQLAPSPTNADRAKWAAIAAMGWRGPPMPAANQDAVAELRQRHQRKEPATPTQCIRCRKEGGRTHRLPGCNHLVLCKICHEGIERASPRMAQAVRALLCSACNAGDEVIVVGHRNQEPLDAHSSDPVQPALEAGGSQPPQMQQARDVRESRQPDAGSGVVCANPFVVISDGVGDDTRGDRM